MACACPSTLRASIQSYCAGQGVVFFVVAPFCSCPASLVSRNFFAVGPGCAKCFFFVALRWAPRPFGGARAKKKHHPGCFFLAPAPGKGRGRRSPVPARGQSKKKNTTQGVFFLLRPRRKAREGEAPLEAGTGPEQKKKHHPGCVFFFAPAPGKGRGRRSPVGRRHGGVFFFALAPCRRPTRGFSFPCLSPGPEQKKNTWVVFFFLLWPRAGAQRGFSFPCLSPGPQQKKNSLGGVFFLLWPRAGTGLLLPLPFPGAGAKKKKHPGWCFFFAAAPARTLTHSLRAWVAMPPPRRGGVCFFAAGRGRTGVVFFFLLWPRPDAHSLTVGWGDFGKARVVFFFFCCGPAGSF